MKRKYPEKPILAVSAVIFQDDSVLLARRSSEPGKGTWSLPGGAVELGETLIEAVQRELWEETYLKVEISGVVGVFDRILRDDAGRVKYHYVLVDYWGRVVEGNPAPGSDIEELTWIPISSIDTFVLDRELKSTIRKAVLLHKAYSSKAVSRQKNLE